MVTAADPLAVYTIAEEMRDCAMDRLSSSLGGEPERSCTVTGAIAWDHCECGQLAVSMIQTFLSNDFPVETAGAGENQRGHAKCGPALVVAEYLVSIIRCAPTGMRGSPPTCAQLDESARVVSSDAQAVRLGVQCCLSELTRKLSSNGAPEINNFVLRDQAFVGPQGSCVGSELRVLVAFNNACPCGAPNGS